MSFNPQAGPSSQNFTPPSGQQYGHDFRADQRSQEPEFDVLTWWPKYQSCQRHFVEHAQHEYPSQALAAFLNIQLPFQRHSNRMGNSSASSPRSGGADMGGGAHLHQPGPYGMAANPSHGHAVSLIPYIRRLVATGYDTDAVLHGFFGDDWREGVGKLHATERRNYMFASKCLSWLDTKKEYDMSPEETVPFLNPLRNASEADIQSAEESWSEWLAMQDWMVGPRSPEASRQRR